MAMKRVRSSAGNRKHSGADSDITTKIRRTQANPSCDNEPIESLEVDPAESLASEIKAVRFKVEAVKIKNAAVKIKIEAVEIYLGGNSTEIAHSTNIHVQRYKSLTKPELLKAQGQLQDMENKLLHILLEEKKNPRGSGGKANYLAFLVRLLFLNLVPC